MTTPDVRPVPGQRATERRTLPGTATDVPYCLDAGLDALHTQPWGSLPPPVGSWTP